eukprot:1136803-Pelagomonas_calceolata.AAC.1
MQSLPALTATCGGFEVKTPGFRERDGHLQVAEAEKGKWDMQGGMGFLNPWGALLLSPWTNLVQRGIQESGCARLGCCNHPHMAAQDQYSIAPVCRLLKPNNNPLPQFAGLAGPVQLPAKSPSCINTVLHTPFGGPAAAF